MTTPAAPKDPIWIPLRPWVDRTLGISPYLFLKGQESGQFDVRILRIGERDLVFVHREDARALEAKFRQPLVTRAYR